MKKPNKKEQKIIDNFTYAYINRNKIFDERHSRAEFYHSDVEGTLSDLTEYQKETIKNSYNIPISTKLSYPIIEQIISFLTGPKPVPRLISASEVTKEFSEVMTKAFYGVWAESKGNDELKKAIQDAVVTGSGYIMVKKNNFFEESTFNTTIKQCPWHTVFVDPQSREADFRDAEFLGTCEVMTKAKAEKLFDTKITNIEGQEYPTNLFVKMPNIEIKNYWSVTGQSETMAEKWVIVLEYFEKVENNVYISENGDISGDKPTPIEISNPAVAPLKEEIMALEQSKTELLGQTQGSLEDQQEITKPDMFETPEDFQNAAETEGDLAAEQEDNSAQIQEIEQRLQKLSMQLARIPKMVTAYEMETVKEETVIAMDYKSIKKKQIKRTLLVNDKIIEEETLISNRYPIHHIYIDHNGSPNKTYGMIHKIKDLVKAMNKFWSAMLYDSMSNNNKKVLYADGTILENSDLERKWNTPGGAFIKYRPNSSLPNGGAPTVIEPSPLNQAYPQIIEMLKQLVEYVTGIHGIMQGNNKGGTSTFGGIQSLQNFGTQRIKLYSRNIENALSDLAYTTVTYLQHYAPVDKVLTYFDDNGDSSEIRILNDFKDVQFKVRVDITNSLPTQRQAAVQLLGNITQTTQDPQVGKLLTELMLEYMDMPEGNEILKKINTVENLQAQLQQLQTQLEQSDSLNKTLEHNLNQVKTSNQSQVEAEKAKGDIKAEKAKAVTEIKNGGQEEEIEEEPIIEGEF